jgi:hypothetical protein
VYCSIPQWQKRLLMLQKFWIFEYILVYFWSYNL